MATRDVGSAAGNGESSVAAGTTFFALANPANISGVIDTVEIWAASNMSGLKVGIFYQVSGAIYKCRSVATIGSVTAGSKKTFSGLNLAVVAGDYIGFYHTGGALEYGSAGRGRGYLAGDHVIEGQQNTFGIAGGGSFSCYGTGYSGPPLVSSTRLTSSFAGATMVANITHKGGYAVTKRGVAYNLTGGDPDPAVDSKVEETGDFDVGEFSEGITDIAPGTTVYVRPYAYSVEQGYGYGTTLSVAIQSEWGKSKALLNSRLWGYPADVSFGAMRGGAYVHQYEPVDTNPDNLCGVDSSMTASPWLFRTFLYFDL